MRPNFVESVVQLRGLLRHDHNEIAYLGVDTEYRFRSSVSSADNGTTIIRPDNIESGQPGRWIKRNVGSDSNNSSGVVKHYCEVRLDEDLVLPHSTRNMIPWNHVVYDESGIYSIIEGDPGDDTSIAPWNTAIGLGAFDIPEDGIWVAFAEAYLDIGNTDTEHGLLFMRDMPAVQHTPAQKGDHARGQWLSLVNPVAPTLATQPMMNIYKGPLFAGDRIYCIAEAAGHDFTLIANSSVDPGFIAAQKVRPSDKIVYPRMVIYRIGDLPTLLDTIL